MDEKSTSTNDQSEESKPKIPNELGSAEPEVKFTKKQVFKILLAFVVLFGGLLAALYLIFGGVEETPVSNSESMHAHEDGEEHTHTHSDVDVTKLPLGDDMYSSEPRVGYVYSCQTTFNGGGAHEVGPWVDVEAGTWDLTKKISVLGSVSWPEAFWTADSGEQTRTLSSADLPVNHTTGTFPIQTDDPAYQYDRNPNSIAEQSISFSVPMNPTENQTPACVGGEVGIATTGVLIFGAFDAAGRDAVAIEVQDECSGHPQQGSYYHYHGYSNCFDDTSGEGEHSDLLGYAFDGFGIFGLKGEDGVELSSKDLDVCHGHTHTINWDGEEKDMYHYHFTQDFPYSVSCFKGEPAVTAVSSGEGNGGFGTSPTGGPAPNDTPPNGPQGPPPPQ